MPSTKYTKRGKRESEVPRVVVVVPQALVEINMAAGTKAITDAEVVLQDQSHSFKVSRRRRAIVHARWTSKAVDAGLEPVDLQEAHQSRGREDEDGAAGQLARLAERGPANPHRCRCC